MQLNSIYLFIKSEDEQKSIIQKHKHKEVLKELFVKDENEDDKAAPSLKKTVKRIERDQSYPSPIVLKKASEAEDIPTSFRPHLKRQSSVPSLIRDPAFLTKEQDIERKHSALWRCVDRLLDLSGGYFYDFDLRQEYDDVTPSPWVVLRNIRAMEKVDLVWPAVEPLGSEIQYLDPEFDLEKWQDQVSDIMWEKLPSNKRQKLDKIEFKAKIHKRIQKDMAKFFERADILRQLGIVVIREKKKVRLRLPDMITLSALWEKLRETKPHLPPLDFEKGDGIADDISFILIFFRRKLLLSSGKEFLHDFMTHILRTIMLILELGESQTTTYEKERAKLVRLVAKGYRRVMIARRVLDGDESLKLMTKLSSSKRSLIQGQIEKLEAALGSLVDNITATYQFEMIQSISMDTLNTTFDSLHEDSQWENYLQRRFGRKNVDKSSIKTAAKLIREIEKEFDELRC